MGTRRLKILTFSSKRRLTDAGGGMRGGGWMTGGELVGSGCTRGQAAGAMQIAQGGGAAHRHEDCGAERKVLMNGRSPQER